ncbi:MULTISPECIES: alkaline phosphatase D family protein [Halomonadaceae]|uniref:alkaline phosphatase D family protein n=1 Tax=Halomonadaceae TaxID=28256 RepID=UPI00158431B0|nr:MULTISPECIES: alkaline phosphatase D family protein [Halomonas]MDI4636967.1 alkaline phosphatase D family protein [Halomonas sp. BMC7]NUJ58134.1 alkaline phosphatase D family protein [Halomonas taeanensis]
MSTHLFHLLRRQPLSGNGQSTDETCPAPAEKAAPSSPLNLGRRQLLSRSLQGAGAGLLAASGLLGAPAIVMAEGRRPSMPSGVMSGDVTADRAMLWSQTDRPSRMMIELADNPEMRGAFAVRGPTALPTDDLTARLDLAGIGRHANAEGEVFYRVRFADLSDHRAISEPLDGRLVLPPNAQKPRALRFVWSGDTVGQGWGINPDFGGLRLYETMRRVRPDFFLHSGDTIYADGPLQETVTEHDGSIWHNIVTPAKSKVAETLDEYRGQYAYNLMDDHLRRLNAEVPMFAQWDDHETLNNWYPGEILDDARYAEKNVDVLSANARQAFLEYMPLRTSLAAPERVYRKFSFGPSLEMFMLDMRSFRGPNSANRQSQQGPETDFLGRDQLTWLKQSLKASNATWKVIASDMPLGIMVRDGDNFENSSNGDGPVLGREQDIAELLKFVRDEGIENLVWLTADVHYTAAHHYSPERAVFKEFTPFWEFVSGPIHAGTYGPGELDNTFGPKLEFVKAPPEGRANMSPREGFQFFGQVDLDPQSEALTVTLKDIQGDALYSKVLMPA